MSLRAKVRQLIVVPFTGTVPPLSALARLRPGGVIYFGDNLIHAAQVTRMSHQIERNSRRSGVAALIMTDQEGGTVTRLPGPVSSLPGGIEFHGNAHWSRRVAHRTGAAMRRMGLNVDLAPVADVDTVGDAGVIGPRSVRVGAGSGLPPRACADLWVPREPGRCHGEALSRARVYAGRQS